MKRREFLRWLGVGTGTAATELGLPLRLLAAADPEENPLAGSVARVSDRWPESGPFTCTGSVSGSLSSTIFGRATAKGDTPATPST